MGFKCKHIELKNIPLNGKYLFVQWISRTSSEKFTHVCDVPYFFLYFVFCNLNFRFPKDNLFWITFSGMYAESL